jgi:hypothetical protein
MHVKNTYHRLTRKCSLQIICIVGAALLAALSSCNNNKGNKATNDSLLADHSVLSDSMQIIHDIDSADYTALFKYKANIWLSKVLNNSQTKWDNFHLSEFWKVDSLKEISDTLEKGFLTEYAMFLTWSPDSMYLLDRGSYGVTMAKDKNGKLYVESGDVDGEVRLYNTKKHSSARLLFYGPSTNILDARWTDSSQVALLGTFDTSGNHHPDTTLWLIDIKDNFFRKYTYHN